MGYEGRRGDLIGQTRRRMPRVFDRIDHTSEIDLKLKINLLKFVQRGAS